MTMMMMTTMSLILSRCFFLVFALSVYTPLACFGGGLEQEKEGEEGE
jgi:hypothetical protein